MALELGRVTDRKPPFKYSSLTRVGFSDTDAQGIVYYGRYLPYFDSARVEYHRHLELLVTEPGEYEFVMRANTIEYHAPARFDDLIEVFIRVSRIGRTSVTYEHAAYRADDDVLMVTATQTLVLVDLDERRACAVPEPVPRADRGLRGRRPGVSTLETIERIAERGEATSCSRWSTCCTTRSSTTPGSGSTSSRATTSCSGHGTALRRPSTCASRSARASAARPPRAARPRSSTTSNADPRYLACFPSTRSEIVVPIAHEGRVVGEIDIDSDRPAAFGEDDRALLERVASIVAPFCN